MRAFANNPLTAKVPEMVAYPSKGRGACPLLPPFPFLLCNARGRGILLAKNHQDENAIAQTHIRIPTRAHSPASAPRSIASSPRSSRKSPLPSSWRRRRTSRPPSKGSWGILRVASRLRHRAGARRCGVRLRGASAQHVTEPRNRLRVGLHERRGAFDAGRARCGLYRGLASSLSQFLALEREDFNL